MLLAEARIINYDSGIVIYSFIVLATVIMIVNYDRTVLMIVNYDRTVIMIVNYDHTVIKILNYDRTVIVIVNYDHTGIMTVNCDRKIFYSTGHWCQCYKAFYVRNLRMFVVSLSVCHCQVFLA